ncbi:MAG: 2,3-diphosphoglycerate-dependent phosphoglycerate mutase [Actinobacteria bacterium]|nr:MAG: 2,3-diphosphoglycerate-dependent phosphoglycerate mutase [Actinomycetota bacterium]
MPGTLIVLRHGQSTWNELGLFTGWHDVPLTPLGIEEAKSAGVILRDAGMRFGAAHTSLLLRATHTTQLVLHEMHQENLPVAKTWLLNERHYGALQGLDKKATTERHGAEQTMIWRRSFDVAPPPAPLDSPEHPANDPNYQNLIRQGFDKNLLPATECLKDVLARVLPYWDEVIRPQLQSGVNVLVTAHGNSIRALAMHLEQISAADITQMNIPTGVPRSYEFTQSMAVKSVYFMGDQAAIAAATDAVSRQATTG